MTGPDFGDQDAVLAAANAATLRDEDVAGSFAGTATSEDGLVSARVDGGRLQAIDLDPKAMRKSGDELARLIVGAVREARADHVAKREQRVDELGVRPPTREQIAARLELVQQLVRSADGDMRTVAERVHDQVGRDDDRGR